MEARQKDRFKICSILNGHSFIYEILPLSEKETTLSKRYGRLKCSNFHDGCETFNSKFRLNTELFSISNGCWHNLLESGHRTVTTNFFFNTKWCKKDNKNFKFKSKFFFLFFWLLLILIEILCKVCSYYQLNVDHLWSANCFF